MPRLGHARTTNRAVFSSPQSQDTGARLESQERAARRCARLFRDGVLRVRLGDHQLPPACWAAPTSGPLIPPADEKRDA